MKRFVQIFLYLQSITVIGIDANPLLGENLSIQPAEETEFPFMVSLSKAPHADPQHHICGATLITKRLILTARHCFEHVNTGELKRKLAKVKASIGSHDWTQGKRYGIESYKRYEDWAWENNVAIVDYLLPRLVHDIVVARLDDDVDNAKLGKLSKLTPENIYNEEAVIPGWGMTFSGLKTKFLQKATVKVLSPDNFRELYYRIHRVPVRAENHLCTIHTPSIILGPGDSGGPLLVNGHVVGVNVHVFPEDIRQTYVQNGHQSIHYYRRFINSIIENEKQKENSSNHGDGAVPSHGNFINFIIKNEEQKENSSSHGDRAEPNHGQGQS